MAVHDYLPRREADLVQWISNFSTNVQANYAAYGISSAQSASYAALATTYFDSYRVATQDSTRTRSAIQAKDTNRKLITDATRQLARMIQANPNVTDPQRINLQLTVRATPAPIVRPTDAPTIQIVSVVGRTIRINLRAVGSDRRGRPDGVNSAAIWTFIGSAPPASISDWDHHVATARTTNIDLTFPPATPPGAQAWIVAQWKNPRQMTGPASLPMSDYLGGGVSTKAA